MTYDIISAQSASELTAKINDFLAQSPNTTKIMGCIAHDGEQFHQAVATKKDIATEFIDSLAANTDLDREVVINAAPEMKEKTAKKKTAKKKKP